MNKRCCRYFGGMLTSQTNWLNKMAAKGYRLSRTGKALYEFVECTPGAYQYSVEFIGQKSAEGAADYVRFLEDCGYRVFFKNINLNWSVGKVVARPWAERGGQIAASGTTLNRELLIVEKKNDGKPFKLHTTCEDQANFCRQMRKPWLYLFLISTVLGIAMHTWVCGGFAVFSAVGLIAFQIELSRLERQSRLKEW